MRKYLLAGAAALVFATPAAARDGSMYVGIEAGGMFVNDMDIDGAVDFDDPLIDDVLSSDVVDVDFKTGYDIDGIIGYDFGGFRLEGELAYKRAKADNLEFNDAFLTAINNQAGTAFTDDDFDVSGRVSVLSGMINGMMDFGPDDGLNGFIGAGIGRARVKAFGDSDSAWAYQLIAGLRTPITESIDLGLKYRFFRTGKLEFTDAVDFDAVGTGVTGGTALFDANERFGSHSLLASLIFNFGSPAAPPPPPPPVIAPAPEPVAPATQTCPDGSVILATSVCPPPPPPPPAPVERGERGR